MGNLSIKHVKQTLIHSTGEGGDDCGWGKLQKLRKNKKNTHTSTLYIVTKKFIVNSVTESYISCKQTNKRNC